MVGVKGKYKGCNTCRVRRVKCDNTRPFCKKCTDHGRVCEGYERETVFIVGTVDDKGRCASHPPRNLGQSSQAAASSSPSPSRANSRKKQAKKAKAAADAATIGSFSSSPSSSAASPQLSLRETASASPSAFAPSAAGGRGRGSSFASALGGLGSGGSTSSNSVNSPVAAPAPAATMAAPLEALEPLMPAWDDRDAVALVSSSALPAVPPVTHHYHHHHHPSFFYRVRFLALRTQQLDAVLKFLDPMTPEGQLTLTLPPSRHRDAGPASMASAMARDEVGFRLSAQCFVHVPFRALGGGAMTMHHAGGPGLGYSSTAAMPEGVCLFLYDHNASAARSSSQPPWRDPTILADPILSLGPQHFQSFPSHHLFARVYRPNAIMTSLLARTPCRLASPEWATVPYERHPKSSLDAIFDVLAAVPALLHRADRVLPLPLPPAALGRRLKARDLLANCVHVEAQLARWSAGIEAVAAGNRDMPLLYWIHGTLNLGGGGGGGRGGDRMMEGLGQRHAQIPFADTYDFSSTVVGLGYVYYWTSLMLLYECMAALVDAVLYDGGGGSGATSANDPFTDPASAGFPTSSPAAMTSAALPGGGGGGKDLLPPGCEAARYQIRERRKLAAHICRSLDWVIGSSPLLVPGRGGGGGGGEDEEDGRRRQRQRRSLLDATAAVVGAGGGGHPDLALAPLHVVERFYGALWSPDGRDGELERVWCRDFRTRLGQRGREVEDWVGGRGGGGGGGRGWLEVGRFE